MSGDNCPLCKGDWDEREWTRTDLCDEHKEWMDHLEQMLEENRDLLGRLTDIPVELAASLEQMRRGEGIVYTREQIRELREQ